MKTLSRRRFLVLGLSATAASVAGCSSPQSSAPSPDARWLPASDGGSVTAYIDFTLSEDTSRINPALPLIVPSSEQDDANLAPTLSNLNTIDDPLLTFPLQTGGRVLGGAVLSLAVVGLGRLVDPARPAQGITELFFADGVSVGRGDFDTDDVTSRLRTGPERAQFEVVGEEGEYTLYGLVEGNDGFAAVSESAVVVANARERVEAVLDTRRGNRRHAAAADDTFGTLLSETDTGHVLVGWEGPVDLSQSTFGDPDGEPAAGLVSTDDDVVSSVTFESADGELTADLAFEDTDSVNAAQLEERLGSASAETSISVDGNRVTATGTYTENTVDLDFVADEPATPSPTVPREGDLPPKVAEAVPADAFEFTFVEEEGLVRVEFTAELDAEKVTLRARDSGYESSTTTPNPINSLSIYVDPESDVVLVIVTVDDVSGVVSRHEVP